jgi:hypothetical protein
MHPFPSIWEDLCIVCIFVSKAVNILAELFVMIRLRADQTVESFDYRSISDQHSADAAYA